LEMREQFTPPVSIVLSGRGLFSTLTRHWRVWLISGVPLAQPRPA
jgi:hypothetical protein